RHRLPPRTHPRQPSWRLEKELAAEIRRQRLGQSHRAVLLAPVLDQRRPDAGPGQRRAVDRVYQLGAAPGGGAIAHVGAARLIVAEPTDRGDLEPAIDARRV